MTAHNVETETSRAVIDRPYSYSALGGGGGPCRKVSSLRRKFKAESPIIRPALIRKID